MSYIFRNIIKKMTHAATPEIHKGKRRRKTTICLAELYVAAGHGN